MNQRADLPVDKDTLEKLEQGSQSNRPSKDDPIDGKCIRAHQPTYLDVVKHDPMLHALPEWREAQIKDHSRWTRWYLFPTVKYLAIALMWVTRVIKRIMPFEIGSERALNFLSIWFMRECMAPEGQEIIYRHFALENIIMRFINNNCGAKNIPDFTLMPNGCDEMGDAGGMNITLLHDANVLNFIMDLGQEEGVNLEDQVPLQELDFSGLELPELNIEKDESKRLMNLDFQTGLYIMVLFLVFLLDEKTQESSANSLTLDESLMNILSNLTGDSMFRHWSPMPYLNWVHWPLDPAKGLQHHILAFEYAYTRLLKSKEKQESSK